MRNTAQRLRLRLGARGGADPIEVELVIKRKGWLR
jgi:hypothetical protein